MAPPTPAALKPRKKPRQARARVTVDAIFEATVQVLLRDGLDRLTTSRVAERAGVSVGTMYQYFPHKQALIYALNERYLEALAEKIEDTCRIWHGAPADRMVAALVEAYWQAKTERADVTRALYRSVAGMDNSALVAAFADRVNAATGSMLSSAPDMPDTDLATTTLTLVTVIFGTVRNVFEQNLPLARAEEIRDQLLVMCHAYLGAARTTRGRPFPAPAG